MLGILSELFINLVILVATITLGNLIVREKIAFTTRRSKLLVSVLWGLLGCLLMFYSVRITPSVIIDFRCIPIMVVGIYSSVPAAIITAGIIGLFRILYFGVNAASIASLVFALLMAISCGLIGKLRIRLQTKWILAYFAVSLIAFSGFFMLINDPTIRINAIFAFDIGLAVVTVVTYAIKTFIMQSNEAYFTIMKASNIDFLTGLHNVRHFDKTLNEFLLEADSRQKSLSLLFIDIDHFKKVNDIHGHLSGDAVLKELGDILRKVTRDGDIITRKGGEEFTVLLPDCALHIASQIAERIRLDVENYKFRSDRNELIQITVSIGVSVYPETTLDKNKLIEQADIALYNAKRSGRNKVIIADMSASSAS